MNIFKTIKRLDKHTKKKIQIGSIIFIVAILTLWLINSLLKTDVDTLTEYYASGDYHKVITLGKEYIKNNPKDVRALSIVSISMLRTAKENGYLDTKVVDETIKMLKTSYRVNPNESEISRLLGNAYFMTNNYPVAKAFYVRADAESKGTNIAAITGLGRVNLATGLFIPAENEFKRAQQLDPDYPDVILALAEIQLRRGKLEQSISMTQRIFSLDSVDLQTKALANQLIGLAYLSLKQYKNAESKFNEALSINPSLTSSLIGKAQAILYMLPTALNKSVLEYTEVPKKLAEQAISYDKNNIQAYNILTQIYLLRNDDANAIITAKKAVELSKNSSATNDEKKQMEAMLKFAENQEDSLTIKSIKVIKK